MAYSEIDNKAVNTIRVLAVDGVAAANSGHPGAPMGLAPLTHVLFKNFLRFNPKNPEWFNRDRFVLSNGHGCMLQYVMLHLYGYPYSIDDLKNFRKLHSKTPGHPEAELPGIEVTTGPLGQGISNAVGLAIAQKHLGARYNTPEASVVEGFTYTIAGDGCLMEGVASEAASLAGHLQLGNLIAFYDDNHITIDGDIKVAFTEDVLMRFESYGWHTLTVENGDSDLQAIHDAIVEAKKVTDKPTLIKITTTIGFGSKIQGTHGVHGAPLKADDIVAIKEKWGFDPSKSFDVPQEIYDLFAKTAAKGAAEEQEWNALFEQYKAQNPKKGAELQRRINKELPADFEKLLPTYSPSDPAVASRKLSEIVLSKIFDGIPELIGGSADLTGSNLTRTSDSVDFQPPSSGLGDYTGRYIRYGVREHAMGAILNGLAAFGGIIPYAGTFLNFISYAAGALRLSALSQHQVIWVGTHDSIGLGEDGPTHQPIETLAHFRAIPNLQVWRPADGNETSAAYYQSLVSKHNPSVIALTRQNLPQLEGSSIEKARKGGYTLVEVENPDLIFVATGSEVSISVDAAKLLKTQGVNAAVVSLPDWFTFEKQSEEYKLSVFPDGAPIISVEVMTTLGWDKYSHEQIGINTFGASGPYKDVYKYFGFTPEAIAEKATKVVEFYKGSTVKSPLKKAL